MPANKWTPDELYPWPSSLLHTCRDIRERKKINFIQSHLSDNTSTVSKHRIITNPVKHYNFLKTQPNWIPAMENLCLQQMKPLHSSSTGEVNRFQSRFWAGKSHNQNVLNRENIICKNNTWRKSVEQELENNQSHLVQRAACCVCQNQDVYIEKFTKTYQKCILNCPSIWSDPKTVIILETTIRVLIQMDYILKIMSKLNWR